ncbi:SCP2 sterol-binding domain-containing protein [Aureispira anguillae]|uniref:SCP2 sterol-binding domain-containing protein n=1 Tax=Aureispira anguillae TaxID=2864201 RepID=A0A915YEY0_9BACT|nr:SCP2 sterol-binding domain-containing protein [Aureispira anguillae]BDS11879.1 SCP2 sterol-binding domain-containing protein [Aureispira anguillae]
MTAKEFILGFPDRINPESLEGKGDTCFHFKISGDGGGEFTAVIKGNEFSVVEGLENEAKCVITTSDKVLMAIINREQNPMTAVMFGKLKISNLNEMTKFAKPLGLM